MNRVALDLLLSRLICFSAVFTLISTQTTARISHMNTHLIFCVLMLAELFTTTALHTLTPCAALPSVLQRDPNTSLKKRLKQTPPWAFYTLLK